MPILFVTLAKLMDMDFYLTMCNYYVFGTLEYWMNHVKKTKNPLNEWNVILIYYVMDFLKSKKL
jgi:hypothetical protein